MQKAQKRVRRSSSSERVIQTIKAMGFFLTALLLTLSLLTFRQGDPTLNYLGLIGYITGWGCQFLFGLTSFLIPPYLIWMGWYLFDDEEGQLPKIKSLYFLLFISSLSILLAQVAATSFKISSLFEYWIFSDFYPKQGSHDPYNFRHYLGGVPFHRLYIDFTHMSLKHLIGPIGTTLIFSMSALIAFMLLINRSILQLLPQVSKFLHFFIKKMKKISVPKLKFKFSLPISSQPIESHPFAAEEEGAIILREHPLRAPVNIQISVPKEIAPSTNHAPKKIGNYTLPALSLLTTVPPVDLSFLKSDLQKSANILEDTFLSFGIEAKVGAIHPGPTITSFEVHPSVGVKVQKIKSLENDIALNMQAKSIRIIAPIPGKAAVGIEVPNLHPQEVSFRELLEHYRNSNKKAHIPLLLGKLVNGDDIWADLTKMPHLIIAGATGSGKSVCINTIVMSIIMNSRPDEIKLVMVDPKKVELTLFSKLPHMLAPVITEPNGAAAALNWLVKEMEKRYEILRQLSIRNIHGFNSRKMDREHESSLNIEIPEKLSYIVVIIDELADLMMVSSSDVETPIARIAQMARAVGIHLILATQRPSREVITGIIKANFPTRIAFKVSSRVNSQIIIDENGAETLLGNGDMLFMPPGSSSLVRTQGAFIRDEDIHNVIAFVCTQAPTHYLIPSFDNYHEHLPTAHNDLNESKRDPLFEEAKNLVFETGNASTTFLQRKLKLGYARAASLMDQLEFSGIIGPSEGAKPRKIFYPDNSPMSLEEEE